MKIPHWIPPALALSAAGTLMLRAPTSRAFVLLGHSLDLTQRDFRVFDNFADAETNDNQTPHPNFPGYQGALMAIWKASAEWGSSLHGDGEGDPHQPADLGSGGANFDAVFLGEASGVGGVNDNIHSAISSAPGGVIAYTEGGAGGWRIRYNDTYLWEDGPGVTLPPTAIDLQGIATHQYGFALGLGHSSVSGATMGASSISSVALRSLEADDAAGIQAIYGAAENTKPRIDGLSLSPDAVLIQGANFSPLANEVWFTPSGTAGGGTSIVVGGIPSNGNSLVAPFPAGVGSGDVFVHVSGTSGASLSNAWPIDLGTPCASPTLYCSTSPNSVGPGALIASSGTTSLANADLVLSVSGCPANQPGLFFYGSERLDLPFGEGRRCVGGTLLRLPVLACDGAGSASHALDFAAPPVASGPGQLVPGGRWNFQFWYRDPGGGPSGFNTSQGLAVRLCP